MATLAAGIALGAPMVLLTSTPAFASCVLPPRVSAHPFTGTVIGVDNAGRTATVRTDDGRVVTVHGSPADEHGAVTTVDRSYQVGVRYEFHPINDSDPYQDNSCTATHPIAAASGSSTSPATRPALTADPGRRPRLTLAVGVIGGVGLAAGTGVWLLVRRRSRTAP